MLRTIKTIILTIIVLSVVSLYIIIYSSQFAYSSFSYYQVIKFDRKMCEKYENLIEIEDLERLMIETQDNLNLYENSRIDMQYILKNCRNYTNLKDLSPIDAKIHRDETLNLIKNLHINLSSPLSQNSSLKCGKFPTQADLNITDIYWQVTNTTNGTFYLYNAYYDDRVGIDGPPVVRILSLINVIDPIVKTFCQFWYENVSEPLISEVIEYRYIWYKGWGENKKGATPYLISCRVPLPLAPKHVSLVENRCGKANNVMEVRNKRPENNMREDFIVSVKKLDYMDDVSLQIIEWCEILKILGVKKVEIYVLRVHQIVLKILKFYESENFITVKFIKYPSDLPNDRSQSWHQWIQNELISFHDTFYENMYSYDYMIPMDTDEFIMPLRTEDRTWKDLVARTVTKAKEKSITADCHPVENHYFLLKSSHENETILGIPNQLYFLSNIYRAANFTPSGGNAKTFMKMNRILTIHNHLPFSCLGKSSNCQNFQVAREDGQLAHYRQDCKNPECLESLINPTKDTSLWKYKDEILKNVKDALLRIEEFSKYGISIKLEI